MYIHYTNQSYSHGGNFIIVVSKIETRHYSSQAMAHRYNGIVAMGHVPNRCYKPTSPTLRSPPIKANSKP